MTSCKIEYWVIPPEADGEFAAHMEEVLETYAQPYDPARPILCGRRRRRWIGRRRWHVCWSTDPPEPTESSWCATT